MIIPSQWAIRHSPHYSASFLLRSGFKFTRTQWASYPGSHIYFWWTRGLLCWVLRERFWPSSWPYIWRDPSCGVLGNGACYCPPQTPWSAEHVISLPLTRRRIRYQEAIGILCTRNIFHVRLIHTLHLLHQGILPKRFQHIRQLHMSVILSEALHA
ncbi:hypothetical protein K469DRAFT_374025 [Zopfia rhizophila CBS 207.26]|uniref:DUF7730 domain-containing protein n=1 Tax=Zopfia rhizophila CBS 207.26 TaxID=1314779 RepID=A0A6A6ENQ9_9PEZI|nr:hypothetical protein K469DRAFT_374025 [Zopfia rhizophila CBS 207.26]